jgi:phosphoadenosine phosphosulfate reductase
MATNPAVIAKIAADLSNAQPEEVLRHALKSHDKIAIAFSGAEDVVLLDMAVKIDPDVAVFALDTGRLHAETYRYLDTVRQHYELDLEMLFPEREAVESLVRSKGLFSFYADGHGECCSVRKVAPLRGKLAQLNGWITGQRRDQSPDTRAAVPHAEIDGAFRGIDGDLVKYNPLANWSSAEVWNYIRANDVPFNELHAKGFTSIGCEPCTRTVLPNQHEREGRWWWENSAEKECGLHSGNIKIAANG